MNKIYYFLVFLPLLSCTGAYISDAQKAVVTSSIDISDDIQADTLRMNIQKSTIQWVATEMGGTRSRKGSILFKNGFFLIHDGILVGGNLKVDMETIEVTDMPLYEKVARKNLLDHLNSADFFNTVDYPLSSFMLTDMQELGGDSLRMAGNLSIRGVTKNIEFLAYKDDGMLRANFTFNRFDWGIAYKGSWADKALIDKDIELIIEIDTECFLGDGSMIHFPADVNNQSMEFQ